MRHIFILLAATPNERNARSALLLHSQNRQDTLHWLCKMENNAPPVDLPLNVGNSARNTPLLLTSATSRSPHSTSTRVELLTVALAAARTTPSSCCRLGVKYLMNIKQSHLKDKKNNLFFFCGKLKKGDGRKMEKNGRNRLCLSICMDKRFRLDLPRLRRCIPAIDMVQRRFKHQNPIDLNFSF